MGKKNKIDEIKPTVTDRQSIFNCKPLWITFILYSIFLGFNCFMVNKIVDRPYMDEIFHIPQAQNYCQGRFDIWDPKLTTPPGLYLTSLPFNYLFKLFNIEDWCSIQVLRLWNNVLSLLTYWVIGWIYSILHPKEFGWSFAFNILAINLFSIHFFFHQLYYTDTGSTLFVLLSYAFSLEQNYTWSSLVGLISITFRQTNVVWVLFFMVWSMIKELHSKSDPSSPLAMTVVQVRTIRDILKIIKGFFNSLYRNFFYIFTKLILPYSICFISFGIFLIWNKGIVLGDKSNHIATLHIPQLFYFLSFCSFFLLVHIIQLSRPFTQILKLIRATSLNLINVKSGTLLLLTVITMNYVIQKFTIHHPFLLADNRHITFYIWKDIYRRHPLVPQLMIPIYLAFGWLWYKKLQNQPDENQSLLFWLGYLFTISIILIPSPLLEFRYFILPYLIIRIHLPFTSNNMIYRFNWMKLTLEILIYISLHLMITGLFLYKPFIWGHEPDQIQRFMW